MDVLQSGPMVRMLVALTLCGIGVIMIFAGGLTMLASEYQTSLKRLSLQSTQIGQKALTDTTIAPILEATAQLIGAVNEMVRTAVGVGAFLMISGVLLTLIGYGLIPR
jgi:hypothetical protein